MASRARGSSICAEIPIGILLLSLNIDIISLNAYGLVNISLINDRVKDFVRGGGTISWGIVPTYEEEFAREDAATMAERLLMMWRPLTRQGLTLRRSPGGVCSRLHLQPPQSRQDANRRRGLSSPR
jgi:hypothetical protein